MSQRFFDLSDDVYVPKRWHLVVSEQIKDALERMGATGTRFQQV